MTRILGEVEGVEGVGLGLGRGRRLHEAAAVVGAAGGPRDGRPAPARAGVAGAAARLAGVGRYGHVLVGCNPLRRFEILFASSTVRDSTVVFARSHKGLYLYWACVGARSARAACI